MYYQFMNKIPLWLYIKKNPNISRQNLYRWIREGKIPKESLGEEDHIIKRITIDENYTFEKK